MKRTVFALVIGAVIATIGQPIVGFILEAGTRAGTFSLNASELADAKRFLSYAVGVWVFFQLRRGPTRASASPSEQAKAGSGSSIGGQP